MGTSWASAGMPDSATAYPRVRPGESLVQPASGRVSPNFTVLEVCYGPHASLPTHSHELAYLSFVIRGRYEELVGTRTWDCGTDVLRFHPAGEVHSDRFTSSGGACLNIEPSKTWLGRMWDGTTDRPLATDECALEALRLRDLLWSSDADSEIAIEELVLAMLDVCRRASHIDKACVGRPWVRRAIEYVESALPKSLTLRDVAEAVDLHPTHLARAFRAHTGMTVGTYVRRRRVSRAQCELRRNPARTLSQIAHDTGFADHAHLTRTFADVVHVSPSRYRALSQAR